MIKTGEFLMTGGTLFDTGDTLCDKRNVPNTTYTPKYGLIPSRNASVRKADTLSLLS